MNRHKKITISQGAFNRKRNLSLPEFIIFLVPKRNSSTDSCTLLNWMDGYFTGLEKNIPFHEIVVNLGIKVEFKNTPLSFSVIHSFAAWTTKKR